MRTYPALDIRWPRTPDEDTIGLLLADVDDYAPLAVEEHPHGIRVFFSDAAHRDAAATALARRDSTRTIAAIQVDDEDWAERSQAALEPVRAGRCIVAPPWAAHRARAGLSRDDDAVVIVIQPSMGFGTGHHASTRLCLSLLQRHLTGDARVLDVGTGSGVLAIAAARLGASRVVAVDVDRDALVSAAENVALNDVASAVSIELADITADGAPAALVQSVGPFSAVFANITGAMLQRIAPALAATLAPAGLVITSGFQTFEATEVGAALAASGIELVDRADEDTWVAIAGRLRG